MLKMEIPQERILVLHEMQQPAEKLCDQKAEQHFDRKPETEPLRREHSLQQGVRTLEQHHHQHARGGKAEVAAKPRFVAVPTLQEIPIAEFVDKQCGQQNQNDDLN
jgi:hypothetical protein